MLFGYYYRFFNVVNIITYLLYIRGLKIVQIIIFLELLITFLNKMNHLPEQVKFHVFNSTHYSYDVCRIYCDGSDGLQKETISLSKERLLKDIQYRNQLLEKN